ncbi:hypothetical protein D3C80_1139220 [compost metagenome]
MLELSPSIQSSLFPCANVAFAVCVISAPTRKIIADCSFALTVFFSSLANDEVHHKAVPSINSSLNLIVNFIVYILMQMLVQFHNSFLL